MNTVSIPAIDFEKMASGDAQTLRQLQHGAKNVGFLTLHNAPISKGRVLEMVELYRAFFTLPASEKARVNMAKTGANRGWGAPLSEQGDPDANPDYKQVFDCGFELPAGDPLQVAGLSVYAPNQWPKTPARFEAEIRLRGCTRLATSIRLIYEDNPL